MATYLRPPSSLPEFLVEGHGFQADSLFANVRASTGHQRKRRRWTTPAPRTFPVSWTLTEAQMAALDAWFEDTLLAGERHFIARAATESGLRYWEAVWVAPYTSEPINIPGGLVWRVVGAITTFGESSPTPPFSGELAVTYGLPLEAEAAVQASAALSVTYGLPLTTPLPLSATYGLDLGTFEPFYLLIGDGFRLLLDDTSNAQNLLIQE